MKKVSLTPSPPPSGKNEWNRESNSLKSHNVDKTLSVCDSMGLFAGPSRNEGTYVWAGEGRNSGRREGWGGEEGDIKGSQPTLGPQSTTRVATTVKRWNCPRQLFLHVSQVTRASIPGPGKARDAAGNKSCVRDRHEV